jgi:tRNA (guanosine-2'-O-)-methyltransferase
MNLTNKNNVPLSAERASKVNHVLNNRQNDLTVVLENVNDPHNIAAVMRSCDAVGIMEIFILNTTVNTYRNFDVRKSSSANKWMLVRQFNNVDQCFKEVRKRYGSVYSTFLNERTQDLYSLDLTKSTALVFGNERNGISKETLAHCDGNFIIPQVGMIQSLNISVACAVSVYEAFRQKSNQKHYGENKLTKNQEHDLLNFWEIRSSI